LKADQAWVDSGLIRIEAAAASGGRRCFAVHCASGLPERDKQALQKVIQNQHQKSI
jgi:hypothetical protein